MHFSSTRFFILTIVSLITCGISNEAFAAPSSRPVLAKRSSSTSPSGKVSSVECLIHPDGVVIHRTFDDITSTEEKAFALGGPIDAKIDEAAATSLDTDTTGPIEFSYSFVAFRQSSSGIQDTVTLASFDGKTGKREINPSRAARTLREVINSVCPTADL